LFSQYTHKYICVYHALQHQEKHKADTIEASKDELNVTNKPTTPVKIEKLVKEFKNNRYELTLTGGSLQQ